MEKERSTAIKYKEAFDDKTDPTTHLNFLPYLFR